MSEADSNSSFFKRKKKPKKVNTVDFDELFARGHALERSIQIEQQHPFNQQRTQPKMETNGNLIANQNTPFAQQQQQQQTAYPATTVANNGVNPLNSTPFEVYSKDEAFRKSQKGSGIGYAEKVQSYLTDQQTTTAHPFDQQKQQMQQQQLQQQQQQQIPQQQQQMPQQLQQHKLSKQQAQPQQLAQQNQQMQEQPYMQKRAYSQQYSQPPPSAQEQREDLLKRAQEMPEDPTITQTAHQRHFSVTQASINPAHENEKRLIKSAAASRRNSVMEYGINKDLKGVSPTPSSSLRVKRQITPQEFLAKIQDFVRNAEVTEVDGGQPIWPAVMKSAEEPTPMRRLEFQTPRRSQSSNPIWPALVHANEEPPATVSLQQVYPSSPTKTTVAPVWSAPTQPTNTTRPVLPSTKATISFPQNAPVPPPRLKSPRPAYSPKPRDHSPYVSDTPSVFDSALRNPLARDDVEPPIEQQQYIPSRIAPSPGKAYLDKPSTSPDPFGSRVVEMDAPPTANEAEAATSSIMNSLKRKASNIQQRSTRPSEMDDVITLDLRDNQENLEYFSVPSDYSHKSVPELNTSPMSGRSQRMSSAVTLPRSSIPADIHIPAQLTPDPLTAHETMVRQPSQLTLASYGEPNASSIQETDLYKKLKVGLDRLMETDKFKSLASNSEINLDQQSYSQHLGRAEFGELRKRTTSNPPIMAGGSLGRGYTNQPRSRDSSSERPASAMARMASTGGERGGRRSNISSALPSRDSSLGRHDSRHDNY